MKVLVKLGQLRCLNKNKISKRVVQLIRLVVPQLWDEKPPSRGERQPKLGWANQITYGLINFFVV